MSDAVKSGETFAVYGEGFIESSMVYVERVTTASPPDKPGDTAVLCRVIGCSEDRQSLTCVMPDLTETGTYNLWVANEYGISTAVGLNTTRPLWINDDEIAPGLKLTVCGANMTSAAYGGNGRCGVAFVGKNGVYNARITNKNEYSIEFECPENTAIGEYDIYVSNDGYVWNTPQNGGSIKVTDKFNDIYDIGVSWASGFDYDNVFDITSCGAVPNDGIDDTDAVWNAINKAKASGGGIIYAPEGVYDISEVVFGNNMILAGDGKDRTVFNCTGTHLTCYGFPVIKAGEKYFGIANLTIKEEPGIMSPDSYIIMHDYSFLKNVKLDVPMIRDKSTTTEKNKGEGRGFGVLIFADSHVVIDGCDFSGYIAHPTDSSVKKYFSMTNNRINTTVGATGIVSSYCVFKNNEIIRNIKNSDESSAYGSGIFTRGPSYIANNIIKNTGISTANDGEAICSENYMGGIKIAGKVKDAESDRITFDLFDDVSMTPNFDLTDSAYNKNYLVITAGRGVGQYIPIKSYDETSGKIILERSFKILPNKDSLFSVMPISENVIMYGNYAENCGKGFWLFADCIDCFVAENTGVNTEGILVWNFYKEDKTNNAYSNSVCYFTRIEKNYLKGPSHKSNVVGIGILTSVESSNPKTINTYGAEVKENIIEDADMSGTHKDANESPKINGISVVYSCWQQNTKKYPVIRQIIIEDNTVNNSDRGITISNDRGVGYHLTAPGNMTDVVYIRKNMFNNVLNEITDDRNKFEKE